MSIIVQGDGSCWVAPDGTVTFVGNSSHSGVAYDVLKDTDGGWGLEQKGYVHCSYGYTDMGLDKQGYPMVPTQAQLNSLFDIAQQLRKDTRYPPSIAERIEKFIRRNSEVPA